MWDWRIPEDASGFAILTLNDSVNYVQILRGNGDNCFGERAFGKPLRLHIS